MENNNNIVKPITLAREEFIADLVKLCNNSGLPLFVVEDILKNITQEVHVAARQQLESDKQHYQKQLEKNTQENA